MDPEGTNFFFDKNHKWSHEGDSLSKTFTVADADKFIGDVETLRKIFNYGPREIQKKDDTTVKIVLQTPSTGEVTTRDYGLANSLNLISRNQKHLESVASSTERQQLITAAISEKGFLTGPYFLTGSQKEQLAGLVAKLEKDGHTICAHLLREAQQQFTPSTETLGTPEVVVAPSLQTEIKNAVERIKSEVDPNYFKNISRIDVLMGGPFGQVSSDDPAVVKLNLSKIKQEVKRQLDERFNQENVQFNASDSSHQEIFDEVLTRALIEVMSHEKGHVEDFQPKVGPKGEFLGGDFPGGEAPAENEAQRVKQITQQRHPLPL